MFQKTGVIDRRFLTSKRDAGAFCAGAGSVGFLVWGQFSARCLHFSQIGHIPRNLDGHVLLAFAAIS
jgi:hypothetical protein